jgi:long-chain acyl-CoA synthetase
MPWRWRHGRRRNVLRELSLSKPVEAVDIAEVLAQLPQRMHRVFHGHAAGAPRRPALVDDTAAWTYAELQEAVQHIASGLQPLGIRPGDRLLIVGENSIALAGLLLAASTIDAWGIVVNPRLSPRELDQIRDHSGARRAFFATAVSKEAASHASRLGAVVRDLGPLRDIGITPLNAAAIVEPVEESGGRQVAVLIYTSGTTGAPKGVMLSHENLLLSAKTTALVRRMHAGDKVYLALPISHIVGISLLIMTLMTGATVRLASRYDPAAFVRAVADEGITIFNGVPATYQRLLEFQRIAGLDPLPRGSLRLIAVAGAPLDLDLKSRVEKALGLPLLNGYGITECAPGIAGVRLDAPRVDQAVGTLLPGIEARIVGRDGVPVADGQVGELHVRGRNVMRGYYRAPDLTAKVIDAHGWFNTGDLARCDGGALTIVGRSKELIIRSGFNVYPVEVEAVLNSHDAIVQSAVVGRPVDGNEEVVAFVQLRRGATANRDELMSYCRDQLTAYKRPCEIVVMEALPANATGKILKHKLAESLLNAAKKGDGVGIADASPQGGQH